MHRIPDPRARTAQEFPTYQDRSTCTRISMAAHERCTCKRSMIVTACRRTSTTLIRTHEQESFDTHKVQENSDGRENDAQH
ncbi:hypothetical protein PoB_003196700 [Plakobranchus ocellatus]|uniref:Uncharacterized protein n=1 Tax=Plakobranchus ocellatus TaxID=259542 RepID=A0AAV4AEP1_9GAST|nr:hypothetical protein PoB_003196700 [Plakobranchus ocellatus]